MTTYLFYSRQKYYHDDLIKRLPTNERQRLSSFTSDSRRQFFVLGRALLADALSLVMPASNRQQAYQLYYHPHGKPVLVSPADWHFNISHSGEHLWLALRQHHDIGIDAEVVRPRPIERLANKLFSKQQQQALANADNPLPLFFRYWTRYEAEIKYFGLSVFSDLPEQHTLHFNSYRYRDSIVSLCGEQPLQDLPFYCHDFTGTPVRCADLQPFE